MRVAAFRLSARATAASRKRSMPKVLLSDFNYPDLELERELFGAAGVDLATAQCKTEDDVIAAARDCAGILLQYAPITERVVASLPQLGVVSRVGAGFDTVDTDACVTPHAAFVSQESVNELRHRAAKQIAAALTGHRPENVVNPEVMK